MADVRAIAIETDYFSDTSKAHNARNRHPVDRRVRVFAEDRKNCIWLSDVDD
jgi:hypothetical protein